MKPLQWKPSLLLSLVFAFVLSIIVLPARAMSPAGLTDPAELEAFLDGAILSQMDANHVPGVVVSVVKDGELFLAKGYGYADLDQGVPVDPERTLFRPGSVSKLFVWTAVMQQVEAGNLSLDTDVNEYLDFAIPDTYPEPITLRHLMAHTAGFEDSSRATFGLSADGMRPLGEHLAAELPARVYPPGVIGAYSNYGTSLAGYIVERVSGMPFDRYIEQHIFAPLGMERSTFAQPLPDSLSADMSGGYNYTGGQYHRGGFEYIFDVPAGGLSAPATDMARFMIAHLQNGRYGDAQILQESTAALMHSRHYAEDPRLTGMAHGFLESMTNGRRVISHGGDTLLFHTGLYLMPEENVGLYIATNGTGGAPVSDTVWRAFMNRYFPAAAAGASEQPADFAERIAPYLGSYYLSRSNQTGIEKVLGLTTPISLSLNNDGYVVLSFAGEPTQFVEVEPGLLQERYNPDSRMVYRTDDDGQHLLLMPLPFNFVKLPWYGAQSLHYLILGLGVLLFLGAIIGWFVGFFSNRDNREPQSRWGRPARLAAALFGVLFVVFLVGFSLVFMTPDPAYGVPAVFFGFTPLVNGLLVLPVILLILVVIMVVFSVVIWRNKIWRASGRIYYSLLTVVALALVWVLAYWNLLL